MTNAEDQALQFTPGKKMKRSGQLDQPVDEARVAALVQAMAQK
jgi:predicted TIM-barrel enzyme